MRFEEAYTGWQERRLTQDAAAELLGVCGRTFRRQINRFENENMDGLLDKRMNQVSAQCAPVDERPIQKANTRHPPLLAAPVIFQIYLEMIILGEVHSDPFSYAGLAASPWPSHAKPAIM